MTNLIKRLSPAWQELFFKFQDTEWFKQLNTFCTKSDFTKILPNRRNIFKAFTYCEPINVKVVILGQDPYPRRGQATGLAFAVSNGAKLPASLQNIFREIKSDYGKISTNSDLEFWATQGVLLLNTTLTVEENKPNSHHHLPWKKLVIEILNELFKLNRQCAMLVWGQEAKTVLKSLVYKPAYSLCASHPSPFSYYYGFNDCCHFSKVNAYLVKHNLTAIQW